MLAPLPIRTAPKRPPLPRGRLSSPAEVLALIGQAGLLALDLETTGLNPRQDRIRLLSLGDGVTSLVLDLFAHPDTLASILDALRGKGKVLVAHNAAFDLGFLWAAGLTDPPETVCTYLLAQLVTAGQGGHGFPELGLGACCARWLNRPVDKELQKSDWSGSLTAEQIEYARQDVVVLPPLLLALNREIEAGGLQKTADVELRALRAFVWMTMTGVPFDRAAWVALAEEAEAQAAMHVVSLDALAPVRGTPDLFGQTPPWNWSSPQQVKEVLALIGLEVESTDDEALATLPGELPSLLREHRTQAQLVKMYGANWLDEAEIVDGRLYPGWKQIGSAAGRTSGKAPNCQQIPRATGYKACFTAGPGRVLVKADYHALQMRIAAKLAGDEALIRVFREGGDPHTATARALLGKQNVTKDDRQIAKSANFSLLFGSSAKGLQAYAKMTFGVDFTLEEAERHRAKFFETYPGLAQWHADTKRGRVKETRSTSGRRRTLPDNAPMTWMLNSPVQADEADGLKLALAYLWEGRHLCPEAVPVLAVHDEIIIECPEEKATQAMGWLVSAMEQGMSRWLDPVPAKVEASIQKTWGG